MKKLIKTIVQFSFFIALFLAAAIFYYFKTNEAPILKGEIECSINYKKDLQLDVYLPTKKVYDKTPVLIYFHGGAWIVGSKISINNARFNKAFNELREKGYAIVSPDYTLGGYGHSPFHHCVPDAFDAVAWVEENMDTFQFDEKNIGVIGESAGGHLALMTAFADAENFESKVEIPLQYVVDVYGPTDLHTLYQDQSFIMDSIKKYTAGLPMKMQKRFDLNQYLFGFDPAKDTTKAQEIESKYSPINYIADKKIPTLIIHGDSDNIVPMTQSEILINQLERHDIPYEFHPLKGVDHAFRDATEAQKEKVQRWILEFVLSQKK